MNPSKHADRKRRFGVYEHNRSAVLFFYDLWLEAGGYFSLDNFNILCLWPDWYRANKWSVSSLSSKTRALTRQDL